MKAGRGFFVHLGLLALAAIAAVLVWTRDKPKTIVQGDVTVWSGRGADVEQVVFEGKKKTVKLDAKKDDAGRFFVVEVDKDSAPSKAAAGDAGADAVAPAARSKVTLVSVSAGEKLLDLLAPLKALRQVGKVGDDRAAEFGLAEPEGTLTVRVGGSDKKLTVGGTTPGGGDRYVRFEGNGEVYVVKGDVVRDLDTAESKLIERDLHEWKDTEVARAAISAGGKTREILRGGIEGKRFWADASAPDQNDETASNWMTKLNQLKPTEFVLTPPDGKETVVRLEYGGKSKPMGFVELVKAPGAEGKATYYVISERTRYHAKVASNLAEQVEQDVASVVK